MTSQILNDEMRLQSTYEAIRQAKARGVKPFQIEQFLMRDGYDLQQARRLVAEVFREQRRNYTSAGRRKMIIGALICLFGVGVTSYTYLTAQPGERYIITWGAFIFGAIMFFHGLSES